MPRRSLRIVGIIGLLAVLSCLAIVMCGTHFGRAFLGVTRVRVSNSGNTELADVDVTWCAPDGTINHSIIQRVPVGKHEAVNIHESEVILKEVSFRVGGLTENRKLAGLACRGETLGIEVDGVGQVGVRTFR